MNVRARVVWAPVATIGSDDCRVENIRRPDGSSHCRAYVCPFVAMFALAPDAFAQGVAAAQLSGTVVDESGGALPGVEVTVTHTGTGASRFQITDAQGNYTFTNLQSVRKADGELAGFSQFEQTGIVLHVGDSRSANVMLELGTLAETITSSPTPAWSRRAPLALVRSPRRTHRRPAVERPQRDPVAAPPGRCRRGRSDHGKPRVPRPGCDFGCRRHRQQHTIFGRRRLQQ